MTNLVASCAKNMICINEKDDCNKLCNKNSDINFYFNYNSPYLFRIERINSFICAKLYRIHDTKQQMPLTDHV